MVHAVHLIFWYNHYIVMRDMTEIYVRTIPKDMWRKYVTINFHVIAIIQYDSAVSYCILEVWVFLAKISPHSSQYHSSALAVLVGYKPNPKVPSV